MSDWSDLLHSDEIAASEGETYLFETESLIVEFVRIEETIRNLNDYFVICDRAIGQEIDLLKKLSGAGGVPESVDPNSEEGWLLKESKWAIDEIQIPELEWTRRVLESGSRLMMLASCCEHLLCWLVEQHCDKAATRPKQLPQESRVEALWRVLHERCRGPQQIPSRAAKAIDEMRKIRNEFTHGEWDKLEQRLGQQKFSSYFDAIREAFDLLESHLAGTIDTGD